MGKSISIDMINQVTEKIAKIQLLNNKPGLYMQ